MIKKIFRSLNPSTRWKVSKKRFKALSYLFPDFLYSVFLSFCFPPSIFAFRSKLMSQLGREFSNRIKAKMNESSIWVRFPNRPLISTWITVLFMRTMEEKYQFHFARGYLESRRWCSLLCPIVIRWGLIPAVLLVDLLQLQDFALGLLLINWTWAD